MGILVNLITFASEKEIKTTIKKNKKMKNFTVYTVNYDEKGFPYIEENTIYDRLIECAEETTSPRGVEPIYHLDGTKIFKWLFGKEVLVKELPTEEEAKEAYADILSDDYRDNDKSYDDYPTLDEAKKGISEYMEIPLEVVDSILCHAEKAKAIEEKKIVKYVTTCYENAVKNGNKKAIKYMSISIAFPSFYRYGKVLPFSSQKLNVTFPEGLREEAKRNIFNC